MKVLFMMLLGRYVAVILTIKDCCSVNLKFSADNKQLLDEVFHDIQNYQGRGKCYQPRPKAEADNTYRDLDNFGYHEKPNSIIVLLYIEKLK